MFNSTLFGTNGIRGIINEEFTPEFVTRIGLAIGTYFNRRDILLGYDSRTSNLIVSRAIAAGLASAGTNVFDAGLTPTPALQFAVRHYDMDGAVIVTASHNPPEYNGVKVVAADGIEIAKEEEVKIEQIFLTEKFHLSKWDGLGSICPFPGVIKTYIEAVKNHVQTDIIKEKRFKVVIDPANSVGGLVTPYLLSELGCEVTTINAHLDGRFPGRLPEPKPETLSELSATVKALGGDIGIAHDGDADRCMFVDEKGNVCLGDVTGALIIDYILEKNPRSIVVTPISSSMLLDAIVRKSDSKIQWTKVGSIHVSREMLKLNSIIGVEDNGGIFYGPHQPVRDGAMASALMLELLAERNEPLSNLVSLLPNYYIIKERVSCPNSLKQHVLEGLLKAAEGCASTTLDGIKIFFDDGSVLIRPSGTESIYRVYAEAKDEGRAREIADWGIGLVKKYQE